MTVQLLDTPSSAEPSDYQQELTILLKEARDVHQGTKIKSGKVLTYEEANRMQEFMFRFREDIAGWMHGNGATSFLQSDKCDAIVQSGIAEYVPKRIEDGDDMSRQEAMRDNFIEYTERTREELHAILSDADESVSQQETSSSAEDDSRLIAVA